MNSYLSKFQLPVQLKLPVFLWLSEDRDADKLGLE